MKLLIDDKDLKLLLEEKRNFIGTKVAWDSLIGTISFLVSALTASYDNIFGISHIAIKTFFLLLSIVFFVKAISDFYKSNQNRYSHKDLEKDIEHLNTIQHNHSLVAIQNIMDNHSKRFLVYFDEKWECKLFLNYKTIEGDNENFLVEAISTDLGVNRNEIQCNFVARQIHEKYSVSHCEMRTYNHRLYKVILHDIPEYMQKKDFVYNQKHYYWMSIDEMRNDSEIRNKNLDVVEFVNSTIL